MFYNNEHEKKIAELYQKLQDLKSAKKIVENAIHHNFYNRANMPSLFNKLYKINARIKETKKELAKEKKDYEKSRETI